MKRQILTLVGIPVVVLTMLFVTEQLVMSGTAVKITPLNWPSDRPQAPQKQTGTTGPPPLADLSISKNALPNPVTVGEPLTYTITITNESGPTATGVTMVDLLPANVGIGSPVSSQGSCSRINLIVICNLNTLAGFSTAVVTLVVTPTQATTLINTAVVASTDLEDPDPDNNTANEETLVLNISTPAAVYLPIILKNYAPGVSPTPTPPPAAPYIVLQWDNVEPVRDRVRDLDGGAGLCLTFPCDGRDDGVFRLSLNVGTQGPKIVSRVRLVSEQGIEWDTIPGNSHSVLGIFDTIVLNNPADGSIHGIIFGSTPVTMSLFASDDAGYNRFKPGQYVFTVFINFTDGTSMTAQTTPF